MILTQFDGLNFQLSLHPRELKVLVKVMELVANDKETLTKIAGDMVGAGFPYSANDVSVLLKAGVLQMGEIAAGLRKQHAITEPFPEDAPTTRVH